jgi:hypothetical protein
VGKNFYMAANESQRKKFDILIGGINKGSQESLQSNDPNGPPGSVKRKNNIGSDMNRSFKANGKSPKKKNFPMPPNPAQDDV